MTSASPPAPNAASNASSNAASTSTANAEAGAEPNTASKSASSSAADSVANSAANPAASASETRADKFVRELAELKIPDPAAGKARLWLRIGVLLMVAGLVLGVSSYFLAHDTTDPLEQRDALGLGLGGIAIAVVGSAVFLRYSLTAFLRFWMARQSYDLNLLADRLCEGGIRHDLGTTDTPSR